jgi:hypothetical protein
MPAAVVFAVNFLATYGAISAATAVAIGTFALTYGTAILLVGGLAYSAAKAREAKSRARDAYNAAQVDRLVNITSTRSPRDLVLGRVRKAGTLFYKGSTGANSATLYLAFAVAGHEVDAIETIYVNDVPVTLDGSGNVLDAPYYVSTTITAYTTTLTGPFIDTPVAGSVFALDGGVVSYQYVSITSYLRITKHLGAPGQTVDADMAAAFPADWPGANVVQGVAYIVARLTFSENAFPQGVPNITSVVRGAKLYDPRTATTVWSQNPALMVRHVYQHGKFGKASVTAAEDARFIAAANACDTSTVYTVGGVAQAARPLYQAAIVAPFGTAARSLFDDISQAMGGSWAFAGGEIYLKAGVYTASVMSLTDADLAVVNRSGASEVQTPIKISVHKERAQKFNTVKAGIWDSAQDYKQVTLAPLAGAALVARDGAELVQEVAFPGIGYAPQAQHVAGVMMRDSRDALILELPVKLRAYPLELFDTIDLTLARYGWAAKTFMVLGRQWAADGSISLTLKETTAAITQMDAGFLPQGFAPNTNLPSPWLVDAPGTLTITSGTAELLIQLDGTITSRMRISWATVPNAAVVQGGTVEVQYRLGSSTGAWSSVVVPGDQTSVAVADVQDGSAYLVRARCKTQTAVSDWGLQVLHTVVGKTQPPPPFDTFTVLVQPDGTRQFNFGYTAGNSPADWLGAEIRYTPGTVGSPNWATMTPLQDVTTYYTSSPVEINAPLAGPYTFACKSLDTTGNESTYLVRSLTLPDRRLGNVFDEFFERAEGWLGSKTGCHVQDGGLEANDSATWATLPGTWDTWTRWNLAPTSPITYESPVRDFGTVVAGQVNSTIDADGTVVQELATSADGTTWSAWGSAAAAFSTRYLKLRLTITATGPAPVPVVRDWHYQINAPIRSEYLNDIVLSALTGSYRIGVGDVRIPLAGTYAVLKRTTVVIQDSSAGTWASTRIDQTLTFGPRWQFRLNGTLADPTFVDFFIEGY